MKLGFLKRKKLIGVGVTVGIVWTLTSYFFVYDSSSEGVVRLKAKSKKFGRNKGQFRGDNGRNDNPFVGRKRVNELEPKVSNEFDEVNYVRFKTTLRHEVHENDFGDQHKKDEINDDKSNYGVLGKNVRTTNKYVDEIPMKNNTKSKKRKRKRKRKRKKNRQIEIQTEVSKEQPLPGENGTAVFIDPKLLSQNDKSLYEEWVKEYGYNVMAGNRMSLRRSLPDVRSEPCKRYKPELYTSTSSIIIAFYNEAWSSLIRTVLSILDRTPSNLLKEIILVDDGSTLDHLKDKLSEYVSKLPKVRLERMDKRMGVIQARQLGVEVSKAPVLVFLDSHIEVTQGWLEPLIDTIEANDDDVVTSVMDIINDDTLEYKIFDYDSINVGGFTWGLSFSWIAVPQRVKRQLKFVTEPISTPTMPGGAFAISRSFFDKLGGFDVGMDMWGAENFEMSFKVWMCGGRLLTHPCSHIGHIFKRGSAYQMWASSNLKKNPERVAEVWMDEYKELYYSKTKSTPGDVGDTSSRIRMRKKLKCHSFQWYLDNVYPEMFMPSKAVVKGELRNLKRGVGDGANFIACLDRANYKKTLSIWPCHGQGGNQYWMLSRIGEVRSEEDCFDFAGDEVLLLPCHGQKGNQEWAFISDSGMLQHVGTQLCLGLSKDFSGVSMEKCDKSMSLYWFWGEHQKLTTLPKAAAVTELIDDGYEDEGEYVDEKDEGKNDGKGGGNDEYYESEDETNNGDKNKKEEKNNIKDEDDYYE